MRVVLNVKLVVLEHLVLGVKVVPLVNIETVL